MSMRANANLRRGALGAVLAASVVAGLGAPAWGAAVQDTEAGLAALQRNDAAEAIRAFTLAIKSGELAPEGLAVTLSNRGAAYSATRQFALAAGDFSAALAINRDYAPAWAGRGIALQQLGRSDEALSDINKALALNPTDRTVRHALAQIQFGRGDVDAAIATYDALITSDPRDTVALTNRGFAYLAQNNPPKAVPDFAAVMRLKPNDAAAAFNRGLGFQQAQIWDRADADFMMAVRLDPTFAEGY